MARKTSRKITERNRRADMNSLDCELSSLLPPTTQGESSASVPDKLGEAVDYIKKMQDKLDKLKVKKKCLMELKEATSRLSRPTKLPHIDIHVLGSALEILLMASLDSQFLFNEVIRMLHEEGAEVLDASSTVRGDTVFHVINSKLGDTAPDYENGGARIHEKLKKFVLGDG